MFIGNEEIKGTKRRGTHLCMHMILFIQKIRTYCQFEAKHGTHLKFTSYTS